MRSKTSAFVSLPVLILTVAFLVRVINLNYNSPFTDEAQYIVLGRKVISGHWQEGTPFSWVGGMPLFYPTLAGLFGSFGVVGARFLNVLLGTASVFIFYRFTEKLRLFTDRQANERLGLVAALLLAISPIPLHLSRLATYDMLSFTLFLAGLLFWQRAFQLEPIKRRRRKSHALAAALLLSLSFLAKYVVLVLLILLIILSLVRFNDPRRADRVILALYFFLPLGFLVGGYLVIFFPNLHDFLRSQVRDPEDQSRAIVNVFLRYTLWAYLMALGRSLTVLRRRPSVVLSLISGSLVILAVHLLANNSASVFQHTFLSLMFLLPLGSSVFIATLRRNRRLGYALIVLASFVLLLVSLRQLRALESQWHDSREMTKFLQEQLLPSDRILTQEGDVTVLALEGFPEENITGPFWFEYQGSEGLEAYERALADGYFTYVQLTTDAEGEFLTSVQSTLTDQYEVMFDSHPYIVYRRI